MTQAENTSVPNTDEQEGTPCPAPAATTGPIMPSIPTLQPADAPLGEAGDNEDERLDEALQETMPTSDPISIKIA